MLVLITGWVLLGIFIADIKPWIRPPRLSQEAEDTLALIERARQAGLTDLELKTKYRELLQKYINNAALNKKIRDDSGKKPFDELKKEP
jgi:hypothetical protein